MKTPINYPFVMVEKEHRYLLEDDLDNIRFKFIMTEKQFHKHEITFSEPTAIHFYSIVNRAAEIKGLKFCNRLKTYIMPTKEKRADQIKRLIQEKGLSESEVMRKANVSHNTLTGWDKQDPKSFRVFDAIVEAIETLSKEKSAV